MRPMPASVRFPGLRSPGSIAGRSATLVLALALSTAIPASAGNHQVTVVNSSFIPSQLTIQVGDSVTWTKGPTTLFHNAVFPGNVSCANGCSDSGGNGAPAPTAWSFTRTFNTAGQITYYCAVHGNAQGLGMAGRITVEGGGGGGNPGALRFSSSSYSRNEGGGSATIAVQRVGGSDGAVSVQYATTGGTATPNGDYTPRSGTLDWGSGDSATKTFTVPILEDTEDEGNESVNLVLASPGGGATLGSPSSAVLTIIDNDDPGPAPEAGNLQFSAAAQNAQEGSGSATVTTRRVGGTDGTVSVLYSSADGGATAGDDYMGVSGTLSWGNGDGANKSFDVTIFDDADAEGDETFTLALTGPTGGAGLGSPSTQTVTIVDNDTVEPGPCIEDDHTICLLNERFRVEVEFTRPSPPGSQPEPANAIPFTNRAGMFWFFNENNIEMLVKMQNACVAPFDRYWVFYAATTNVEFTVRVTDTEALQQRTYENPQGMVALPEADTQAFETCP